MSAAAKTEDAGPNPALSTTYEVVAQIDESLVIAKVKLEQIKERKNRGT